ncbi:MAG: ABC transporter substrate-binding protein [Hyphomicrobiaceae bacterium]
MAPLSGLQRPATQRSSEDWHDPSLAPYAFDVDGANALLDEADWARGPDGVREKDGVRLSATVLTYAVRAETTVMATAMQAQLKEIGMELAVQPVQGAAIVDAVNNDTMEMVIAARSYHLIPDPIGTIIADFTSERASCTAMIWALIFDVLIFATWPGPVSMIGGLLIVVASVCVAFSDRIGARLRRVPA